MSRGGWLGRLGSHAIPLRIGALSAVLLGALVVSTAIMAVELTRNQRRIADATERFHRLQVAAAADRDFGQLRYWMTDLAVSLLTLSEQRAAEAEAALARDLDALEDFAPEAARQIRAGAEAYRAAAMQAVDAYTDDNRILGNTYLAQARQGSGAVDLALSDLVAGLAAEADQANRLAAEQARASRERAVLACALIVALGAALTVLVLRSILRPLGRIDRAMTALNDGAETVDLPPGGQGELGRMAETVRRLAESQSERRRLEAEAQERRRTIQTAIETIPDGFALFDDADRLILSNDRFRRMFRAAGPALEPGTPFETFLRAQLASGIAQPGETPAEAWIADRLSVHRTATGLREEVRIGGAWVQVAKRRTPDGGTVAVYSDITDLKDKQAELETARREAESANTAKSRFLASMSHELRTPLNAIIGYSEMLIEDAEDSGQTEPVDDLQKILTSGRHLLSLINDILDLSKIEAGKMEIFVERFALAPLIDEVRATVAPLIQKNGNRLVVEIAPEVDEIETDKTKLRQNLFNLLSNAAKFTDHGAITLGIAREADRVVFTVRDDGIGMTEAQVSRLFQAFVQAEASTARTYGGTGLGLALVRQFAEMLGGSVRVDSEPGKGSVFTLTLPLVHRPPEIGDDDDASAPSVLVVDDDPVARKQIAAVVAEAGYRALAAGDVETGLALARGQRPRVIVLDVIMPERDGWSMLRELRADPLLCDTPVILATVLSDREMGLAFGATDHLTKPVDPRRLVEALDSVAGSAERDVLVVDDDAATRALFRRALVREGWTVREASDGERALAQIATRRPGLIVLDLMMPNLDGFETLRTIRSRPDLAELSVIIATSKELSRAELAWLRVHAGEVVSKGQNGRASLVAAIRRNVSQGAPLTETVPADLPLPRGEPR
jgi:signal transduction histidine kinase/DNA-binding response OmpR family regulator